jgi:hypothetical protein
LAWRKNQSVFDDLANDNWTQGLWRMTDANEMAKLINLWTLIQNLQLLPREDELVWRWTSHGGYTAKTAYQVQVRGTYSTFNNKAIWKAKVEGKHRFFVWLLVQSTILTADKLQIQNWPCNPVCSLCGQEPETVAHITLHYMFAQEVWLLVHSWTDGLAPLPGRSSSLQDWWNLTLQEAPKDCKQRLASILIYAA